ncbi:MAG: hypothetical protein VW684_11970 [Betaproteobacteria bacterium]
MNLSESEISEIVNFIRPIFEDCLRNYDFKKYPATAYDSFKESFSSLTLQDNAVWNALAWKWGHWAKKGNFPEHHKDLIREVESLWPNFAKSQATLTARETFEWWSIELSKKTRYITVAFITHLVHHDDPLPIIDQHNFRAMNSLTKRVRPQSSFKKKPSNWDDIERLTEFMAELKTHMPNRTFSEIDRFLMMYGRNLAER